MKDMVRRKSLNSTIIGVFIMFIGGLLLGGGLILGAVVLYEYLFPKESQTKIEDKPYKSTERKIR